MTGTPSERDGGTAASVRTGLTVTGRPAQCGRGVMAEVGDRLVGRFAQCLSERIVEPEPAAAVAEPREEAGPLDLFRTAGVPVAERAAVAVAAAVVVTVVFTRVRRRRQG
ncbi:hypothetical protein AB0N07_45220 [Streptomyces sp. NPDC051172]|uniref:hypothetical protein n=1 Tax=Streptomyces sp. NPDC051172 TaxID=3155796 RepID=UPI00341298D2